MAHGDNANRITNPATPDLERDHFVQGNRVLELRSSPCAMDACHQFARYVGDRNVARLLRPQP